MTDEKWVVAPGETRIIDVIDITALKVSLVGGHVDVVAHDSHEVRIEVERVSGKDLRISTTGGTLEIDHPQLRWENFLEVFRNFTSSGPEADISIAVPRHIALTLGVVSASTLISGVTNGAKLNTVSGDLMIDGVTGDLNVNAVSGAVTARDLTGSIAANSVSGGITAAGLIRKTDIDTVSGRTLIDALGPVDSVSINSVSGDMSLRIDEDLAMKYSVRSMTGKISIDNIARTSSLSAAVAGSVGSLSGSFLDLRGNSVSGDITVMRRATFDDGLEDDIAPAHGSESHANVDPFAADAPDAAATDAAATRDEEGTS